MLKQFSLVIGYGGNGREKIECNYI